MARKIVSLLLPFLLLTILISTAYAQTSTTTSSAGVVNNASRLKEQMQILQEQKKAALLQVRDEFKAKLQIIKDQRKKTLVQRIDAKLAQVNKRQTERFSEVLTRLQGFLDKIKQSTTDTKVLADIAVAQTAIDTAKTAVDQQAAKTYTIQITDATTLKLNAGTTVSQLRQDLMAVYKLVIDAKQAVQKLNTDRELIKKEATSSAKL